MESFFLSQFLTPNFSQGHYRGEADGHLQKTGSRQKYGVCPFFINSTLMIGFGGWKNKDLRVLLVVIA